MNNKDINKTELVQLLAEIGIRSHRGMSKKALMECVRTTKPPKDEGNPFDEERDLIIAFLKKHWDKVKSQLDVRCHGRCYEHSDMQVLACYLNSKNVLERRSDG